MSTLAHERATLVSFSGIDGAGKSTQIKNLQARLTSAGASVLVLTFWDDIAAFRTWREHISLRLLKGDAGVGSPEKPINRRDKNVSSWYLLVIRLLFCLSDTLRLRWVARRALRGKADVIIFDRYIYDELANLPLDRPLFRSCVRFLLRFVPHPQFAYLLDADPAAARLRKPEYPLEFLHENRQRYLMLAAMAGGFTIVDALRPPEVEQKVLEAMSNRMPAETLRQLTPSAW